MKATRSLISISASLMLLLPFAALAEDSIVQGRTGLPTVRMGENNTWIKHGLVDMTVDGKDLVVTQEFQLEYPSPPTETGTQTIKVAVREDYYRAREKGAPEVTTTEAKGFNEFSVMVDDNKVEANTLPWALNDKKDTATRWREWTMTFAPGQAHKMKIVSRAPLAYQGPRKVVQFVSKDLGHWRDKPDYLEIRYSAPGLSEAQLAGLQPKATTINSDGVQWVYRKADPDRDVFIMLPTVTASNNP